VVEKLLAADPRTCGRVLDAGTGGGRMTALLARFGPTELVSVSLDETSFDAARSRLPAGAAERVSFRLGDLTDSDLVEPGIFDLVVGDYLIAAVAGHRPFRQTDVLAALWRAVAPGGVLILTGMEPSARCSGVEQEVVRTVLRWRDAATYLSGREMYREVPPEWVLERLEEVIRRAGETGTGRIDPPGPLWSEPLTWSLGHLRRLADDAVRRAGASGDRNLAVFIRKRLDGILRRAARLPGFRPGSGPVAWARDWVVRAERDNTPGGGEDPQPRREPRS